MDKYLWMGVAVAYLVVSVVSVSAAAMLAPPGHRSEFALGALIWPLLLVFIVVRLAARISDGPHKEGALPC